MAGEAVAAGCRAVAVMAIGSQCQSASLQLMPSTARRQEPRKSTGAATAGAARGVYQRGWPQQSVHASHAAQSLKLIATFLPLPSSLPHWRTPAERQLCPTQTSKPAAGSASSQDATPRVGMAAAPKGLPSEAKWRGRQAESKTGNGSLANAKADV